jgi:homoaconitase/3-isopropylmalate dehydratase large subunit
MGKTIIQKILAKHSGSQAGVDDIIDVAIDIRMARDFGGTLPLIATRADATSNTRPINIFAGFLPEDTE